MYVPAGVEAWAVDIQPQYGVETRNPLPSFSRTTRWICVKPRIKSGYLITWIDYHMYYNST